MSQLRLSRGRLHQLPPATGFRTWQARKRDRQGKGCGILIFLAHFTHYVRPRTESAVALITRTNWIKPRRNSATNPMCRTMEALTYYSKQPFEGCFYPRCRRAPRPSHLPGAVLLDRNSAKSNLTARAFLHVSAPEFASDCVSRDRVESGGAVVV